MIKRNGARTRVARAHSPIDRSIGFDSGLAVSIDRRWAIRAAPPATFRASAGDSISKSPLALPYEKISANINIADLISAADAGRARSANFLAVARRANHSPRDARIKLCA